MSTEWNGARAKLELRKAAAKGLVRASFLFQQALRQRVSIPNPPPHNNSSKPGEYPRLRTGEGQRAIMQDAETIQEVTKNLYIRVGFLKGKSHLLTLELKRNRLGLVRTLEDLKDVLAEAAIAEFKR